MHKKISWKKIKKKYPHQWVSLIDVDVNEDGTVLRGEVVAHGGDLGEVTTKLKKEHIFADRFEYTGTIKNFLGFGKWTITDAKASSRKANLRTTPPAKAGTPSKEGELRKIYD